MNEERNLEISRLWRLGHSIDAIAKIMDLTRNAIAGVCWRLGLRKTDKRSVRRVKLTMTRNDGEGTLPRGGVEIGDLKDHHCRWIVGKGDLDLATYCGETKTEGSSYCLEHDRIARPGRVARGHARGRQ